MTKNRNFVFITLTVFPWVLNCTHQNPKILIRTEFGDIIAELYVKEGIVVAGNFLGYAKENRLKDVFL